MTPAPTAHALLLGRYTEIVTGIRGKFRTYSDAQVGYALNDVCQTISIMGDGISPEYSTKLHAELDELRLEIDKRQKRSAR